MGRARADSSNAPGSLDPRCLNPRETTNRIGEDDISSQRRDTYTNQPGNPASLLPVDCSAGWVDDRCQTSEGGLLESAIPRKEPIGLLDGVGADEEIRHDAVAWSAATPVRSPAHSGPVRGSQRDW